MGHDERVAIRSTVAQAFFAETVVAIPRRVTPCKNEKNVLTVWMSIDDRRANTTLCVQNDE